MLALVPILLALLALLAPPPPAAAVVRHPHFPKTVELALGFSDDAPRVSVSHLTVTFDADGFESMAAGGTWHLANARLRTPVDLIVGGRAVAPGEHRLLARKEEGGDWELVLDPTGKPFSRELSEEAVALDTEFLRDRPRHEHLRIDLAPTGDGDDTTLRLEVHFDTYVARCAVEIPGEE
ncbi:MAG: hypothetical protein ACF8XB_21000 [Planctomycetota bacterium JB042]